VQPTDSGEFVRLAPRPAYSVLGHGAWTLAALDTPRSWEDALDRAFHEGVFDAELEGIRA
jgi:dTDP-4-dehydrorhamnose reductase